MARSRGPPARYGRAPLLAAAAYFADAANFFDVARIVVEVPLRSNVFELWC